MMSLLVVSMPLLPIVAIVVALFRSPLLVLCRQVYSNVLRLSRRKVCVSSTHAYVFSNCTHGQAHSVLMTFDLYSTTHSSFNIGPQKGEFLDEIVQCKTPLRVLELGTHCGYTSVRILRQLPPSGKLLTVELDPLTADKAEEIILVAGFKSQQEQYVGLTSSCGIWYRSQNWPAFQPNCKNPTLDKLSLGRDKRTKSKTDIAAWNVHLHYTAILLQVNNRSTFKDRTVGQCVIFQVLTCSSAEAISSLPSHIGNDCLDMVLMDHDPELYLLDLLALQRGNVLSTSCVLLINRALTPGAQDFLEYVTARPQSYGVGRQLDGLLEVHYHITA